MVLSLLNALLLACLSFGFGTVQAQSPPLIAESRLTASPGPSSGSDFLPVVIYQTDAPNSLYEVRWTGSSWKYASLGNPGSNFLPKVGTPLASVFYTSTGQIYLYYVSTGNALVERVRSSAGAWSVGRYMGPGVYSGARGMTAYLDPTSQITIWYQELGNTIKRCLWRSTGCLSESGGGPSINDVFQGSDIASLQDDVGHQHVYYQASDTGKPIRAPIKELAWNGSSWNFGPVIENAPQLVSFKAIYSATQGSQFWQLNKQIFNQVTMAAYDSGGCNGWCYAKSIMRTLKYDTGFAVISSGTAIRAYYITAAGKLGELGNTASGWGCVRDVLDIATA